MATSRRQRAFNLMARYGQKPALKYLAHVPTLRAVSEMQAYLTHSRPKGVRERVTDVAPGLQGRCLSAADPGPRRLIYLHGGGFIIGSSRMYRWLAARLALGMGGMAVVPDYRRAPEHPFPAALDDCVATYRAVLAETAANRIAVAGDSAGGWLALALLPRLAAAGLPFPGALGLLSPLVDPALQSQSVQAFRHSDMLLPEAFGRRGMASFFEDRSRDTPEVAPLLADLSQAPPTLIQASDSEMLRDDAVQLAETLPQAQLALWHDVPHVWQLNGGRSPEADRALADMAGFFDRHLAP